MKILVFGINYYPELTGIGKYTAEMCVWLAKHNHQVEMITAVPYYPEWKIHHKYHLRLWHSENIHKVKVHRCPLYVPKKVSGLKRMIHEFSFLLSSSVYWISALFRKHDVVLCICPPFHLGFMGWIYKSLKKTPVIYHIQDLQIDAARNLQILKNESLLRLLEKCERFILHRMTKVSSLSEGMKRNILKKGIPENKYIQLPNWVDTDFIRPMEKQTSLKAQLGYQPEDKIVLYSGNMGEKQGLEIVLEVALLLKGEPHIHFLFVGEGASKQRMKDYSVEKKLTNIKFKPLLPYDQLPYLLAAADLHLVIQKELAGDLMLPSKLLGILSCGGVAIVTAVEGTSLFKNIQENNAGIIIDPDNAAALLNAIQKNIYNENLTLKTNARNYALNELNINKILQKFEFELKEVIHN